MTQPPPDMAVAGSSGVTVTQTPRPTVTSSEKAADILTAADALVADAAQLLAADKITKAVSHGVRDVVDALRVLLGKSLLRQAYLEGQLQFAGTTARNQLEELQASYAEVAKTISNRVAAPATTTAPLASAPPARSAVSAAAPAARPAAASTAAPSIIKPRPSVQVVHLRPKDPKVTPAALMAKLVSLPPSATAPKVKALIPTSRGSLRVEMTVDSDAGALRSPELLSRLDATASLPADNHPQVLLHNVPKTINEAIVVTAVRSVLPECIPSEDISLVRSIKAKSADSRHLLLKVSPQALPHVLREDRVYVGYTSCRLNRFVPTVRCFRCQELGHVVSRCTASEPTCGHCAERGHSFTNCSKRQAAPVCAPCKNKNLPDSHSCRSNSCPSYSRYVQQTRSRLAPQSLH